MLKNLEDAKQQVKGISNLEGKIETAKAVTKKEFDIHIVSANTMKGLFEFLGIEAFAHEYDLDKNLNMHRIDI